MTSVERLGEGVGTHGHGEPEQRQVREQPTRRGTQPGTDRQAELERDHEQDHPHHRSGDGQVAEAGEQLAGELEDEQHRETADQVGPPPREIAAYRH